MGTGGAPEAGGEGGDSGDGERDGNSASLDHSGEAGVPLIPRPRAALRLVEGPGPSAVTTVRDPVSTPPVPAPRLAVRPASPAAPVPASVERPLPAAPVPVAPAACPLLAERPTPAGPRGHCPVARATGQRRPPAPASGETQWVGWLPLLVHGGGGGGGRSGQIAPWPEIGHGDMWR